MMGETDYRHIIKNAIDSIGRELELEIDSDDIKTIHLSEVVQCMRRSYYDRTDPKDIDRSGFNDLLAGLLRKLKYGSNPKEFAIDEIKLRGQADMIADDTVFLFRSSNAVLESPRASDLLYLNACLWIYDKKDGVIVYISGDRKESSFSVTRNKKMFEETVRRVKVLNDLLKGQKTPILEPSENCTTCQYFDRCYIPMKHPKTISIPEMLGFGKDN